MKKNLNYYSSIGKRLIFPLLSIFLLILLLKQIGLYERIVSLYRALAPLLIGIILAFLFQPIIDRLHQKLSLKLSVIIVYVGILLFIFLFGIVLIPILYEQIINLSDEFPQWLKKIEMLLEQYHFDFIKLNEIEKIFMKDGYGIILDSIMSWFDGFTRFALGYMCAFFISLDLDFWVHTGRKIIPNFHQFSTFYKTMSNIIYQYLLGTSIDLLFIVLTVSPILYMAGFPNALFYGVLLALFNLWPYIGATVGLFIIFLISLFSFDQIPWLPLLIVWIIQQVEANIIQPFIFNKTMSVRPILSFAFLFIGEALFGIPGVILSPILAAIAQIVFRSYLHSKTSDQVGQWEDIWYDFDDLMKKMNTE